ncbi:MAG: hypothetical protein JXR05_07550 [Flavobacteriaceae bacterium]
MKKSSFILLLTLIFIGCSENDPDVGLIDHSTPVLRTVTYNTYNVSTNTINRTTAYTIHDNKMESSITTNTSTSQQVNSTYNYSNNRISKISTFKDGNLSSQQDFSYDGNDNLTEYLQESIHPTTQQSFFNQHMFTHTTDTIFSEWKQSSDGNNFNTIATFKIVLDNNSNRTYLEENHVINNEIRVKTNNYDANNNLVTENTYIKDATNTLVNLQSTSITHETSLNLLSLVYQNTYGKENLILLYHLQSNALNNFNSKTISNNSLKTFDTNAVGNAGITFEFVNETGANNYDYLNDYRTYVNGVLLSRFTVEFIE